MERSLIELCRHHGIYILHDGIFHGLGPTGTEYLPFIAALVSVILGDAECEVPVQKKRLPDRGRTRTTAALRSGLVSDITG